MFFQVADTEISSDHLEEAILYFSCMMNLFMRLQRKTSFR